MVSRPDSLQPMPTKPLVVVRELYSSDREGSRPRKVGTSMGIACVNAPVADGPFSTTLAAPFGRYAAPARSTARVKASRR